MALLSGLFLDVCSCCCGTTSGMDGSGGGGDNAKIPLLIDCISSSKLFYCVII